MLFQREISDDVIDKMLAAMPSAKAMLNMVQIRGLGGAFARVDPKATAFSDRDARYMTSIITAWADEKEDATPHRDWIRALWDQISHERSGV